MTSAIKHADANQVSMITGMAKPEAALKFAKSAVSFDTMAGYFTRLRENRRPADSRDLAGPAKRSSSTGRAFKSHVNRQDCPDERHWR